MENIEFVKCVITKIPIESFLVDVKKTLVFIGEHFDNCETIEEIRDDILNHLESDEFTYIEVSTYLSEENLKQDIFHEYAGQ